MYYRERKFNFWKIIHISLDSLYICYLFWFFAENRCWPVWKRPHHFSYIHLVCQTWHSTAGIQWHLCLLNKPGCLSILAHWAPRRAVALWKPCIVFLSCARARFLWRCCVKQRWPSASCKSHVDRPATSPGASPSAAEQPPSPCSVCLFSSRLPPCPFWFSLFFLPLHVSLNFLPPFNCFFISFSSLISLAPISSPPCLIYHLRPPVSPSCFPVSTPPFLFVSLLPSSLCPAVQVRRWSVRRFLCKPQCQTTPREGDFCS